MHETLTHETIMHETITFVWGHDNSLLAVIPADSITSLKDGTIQPEGFPCTLIGMNTRDGEKSVVVPMPISNLEPLVVSSQDTPVTIFISAFTPKPKTEPHILCAVFQAAPIDWYAEGFPNRTEVQSRFNGIDISTEQSGASDLGLEQTERLRVCIEETKAVAAAKTENNPQPSTPHRGQRIAPDGCFYH